MGKREGGAGDWKSWSYRIERVFSGSGHRAQGVGRDAARPETPSRPVSRRHQPHVEVLSESTERYDRDGKFQAYKCLPSLMEYVLVAQDEKRVEVYRRQRDDWVCETAGPEGRVSIHGRSVDPHRLSSHHLNKAGEPGWAGGGLSAATVASIPPGARPGRRP
jgi:Putative restriction endonuclease